MINTYIDTGVRVSCLGVVRLDFVPPVQGQRCLSVQIKCRRIESLQVALLLSQARKNIHFVACHAGRVRIAFLGGDQAGRQVVLVGQSLGSAR